MKIDYCSDLHLEFGYQALPGGEVLVLAGDIAEARGIGRDHHSTKSIQDTPIELYRCSEFFKWECSKYDQVFYVMGNHEHYHGKFHKTAEQLQAILPKNVTLLEDQVVDYRGVMFLGATLWTDLNRGDPITAWHLKSTMNDYKVVQNFYEDRNLYYKLTPEHTAETHRRTKEYFKTVLETNKDKQFVVITHHAPSFQSVSEHYKHDTTMNGGYASNMDEFVLDHPNIVKWIHGHMHDVTEYQIGTTTVLANPRGYLGHESVADNFVVRSFEI